MWISSILSRLDSLIRLQQEGNLLLRELIQAQTKQPARSPVVGEKRRLYTDKDISRVGQEIVHDGNDGSTTPASGSPTSVS